MLCERGGGGGGLFQIKFYVILPGGDKNFKNF